MKGVTEGSGFENPQERIPFSFSEKLFVYEAGGNGTYFEASSASTTVCAPTTSRTRKRARSPLLDHTALPGPRPFRVGEDRPQGVRSRAAGSGKTEARPRAFRVKYFKSKPPGPPPPRNLNKFTPSPPFSSTNCDLNLVGTPVRPSPPSPSSSLKVFLLPPPLCSFLPPFFFGVTLGAC